MIASPCINICRMDSAGDLCVGCFRTLDEITRWARTDDIDRADILVTVTRRRLEADAPVATADKAMP